MPFKGLHPEKLLKQKQNQKQIPHTPAKGVVAVRNDTANLIEDLAGLEGAFDAAVAEVGAVGGALIGGRGEKFRDVLEAFGAKGFDEAHDCAVLIIGGVFEKGFVGVVDEDEGNVGEAIVLADDENEVAAAELFAFGFGEDESWSFGFQNFECEMGGADGDDLVALFFKSGAIFRG